MADAVLSAGLGSNWSAWVTEAVLVWGSGETTRAWIVRVWEVAGVTVPTVHRPLAGA